MSPIKCRRSASELVAATTTLATRDVQDPRIRCLRTGALLASNWVHGFSAQAPVSGRELPQPDVEDVAHEYADAALVAAGHGELPELGECDAGRLVARGVETYLLWYCFPDTGTPALLDGAASTVELVALAGQAGHGPAGLYGPGISPALLPELPGTRALIDATGRLVTS